MQLTTTLTATAAAALIGVWLALRVVQLRMKLGITHGHGESELLLRRMRAQLNYAENTPFVLLLVAGIELSGRAGVWLSWVAAIYLLARLAHAVGMDSPKAGLPRQVGMAATFLTLIGLSVFAMLIALRLV